MKASILLVVLLSAVAVRADFEQSPNSTVLEEIPSNDFVFNPPTPSNTIPGVGYSQRRTSREWPTLVVRSGNPRGDVSDFLKPRDLVCTGSHSFTLYLLPLTEHGSGPDELYLGGMRGAHPPHPPEGCRPSLRHPGCVMNQSSLPS